ncbi:MAG TPA: dihydropteroate synthase [Lachnospiraceae bacterium]|nr:dihydropteroate synthase [Lachnospiraceae bacterium]
MGILNVTPDSFSDGGSYTTPEAVRKRVAEMIGEGADIIDVGGESTRPGFKSVDVNEELKRVIPAVKLIKEEFDIPVSVDTTKTAVAEEALSAGAFMINDVSGLFMARSMTELIASKEAFCCLVHNRKEVLRVTDTIEYLESVCSELESIAAAAEKAGIRHESIILDPGIGFAKTHEQNMMILSNLEHFRKLGYPLLLGASRKSVIGNILGLPPSERTEGTIALSVLAAGAGFGFVRVHDIKENKRAVLMTESLKSFRRERRGAWTISR